MDVQSASVEWRRGRAEPRPRTEVTTKAAESLRTRETLTRESATALQRLAGNSAVVSLIRGDSRPQPRRRPKVLQLKAIQRDEIDKPKDDDPKGYTKPGGVRDVENTVRYLKDDGVIFLHDCNPPFELAGRRADSWDEFMAKQSGPLKIGIWNGDVWKAIVELRSTRPDLLVGVLKCDQGVGCVRKGSPESTLPYSPEQVEALTYADLKADRTRLLNLKPPRYLGEFLAMSAAQ